MTNWTKSNDYTANNNVLAKVKNDNKNVSIADWEAAIESQADTYLSSDGIHPNAEGQELFAKYYREHCGGERRSARRLRFDGVGRGWHE